ncbi:CoA transferase [Ruegeria atlantica]|uniref:Formyl-coenzyme A transferase n=1 Tax=Ruegeria atlantica TaxID=81569 RepID=A0A0P1ECU2_9RHOB|nr:CoA transferase [Ruegeria atlantica]CUH46978.1 Formyl-coenzyme A transferase [Ruegeria atlantica]
MSTKILKGLRVLDLSRMLSGPYCTMHLADHGAEVIKIEAGTGDTSRGNGPFRDDDPEHSWAGYFVSLNRGKKSIQLDLKSDEGKEQFRALAATSDVIVENFRPGVMDRLGLSYETLAEANPRIVYAAIRGFGDPRTGTSPYSDWPSYDVVAQAMGGLMSITGPNANTPTKTGPGVGDIFAGMMMAFGIMAALREAEATGKGQFVDVAMYDAMISLCERMVYLHDFTGKVPGPEGNRHPFLSPFGLYPAADGHVALGIVDDAFWRHLTELMGQPELGTDVRFASRGARATNAVEVDRLVSDWFSKLSKQELTETLGGQVPFGPLNTIEDIARDPHVAARKMLAQVNGPDAETTPWTVAANPLRFGAHRHGALSPPPALGADNATLDTLTPPTPMAPETKRTLRDAFGRFATGVTVVTTRQSDGTPRGFTANSFTSVSLDPPLLLVCIGKAAHSCDTFAGCDHFTVNILADDQKEISGLFALQSPDKFETVKWHSNAQNMPVIDGTIASFGCAQHRLVDAGDHLILIGRVLDFETSDGDPLGYYKGAYFDLGLDRAVTEAATKGDVTIAAVLAHEGGLLLQEEADGSVTLPSASSTQALLKVLGDEAMKAELTQLYAVYQVTETGAQRIVYHARLQGDAEPGLTYFTLDNLPLSRVSDDAERSLLRRYAQEHQHGTFGIYQGTEVEGVVHRLSGNHKYHI